MRNMFFSIHWTNNIYKKIEIVVDPIVASFNGSGKRKFIH
jgi:hypothetical protein